MKKCFKDWSQSNLYLTNRGAQWLSSRVIGLRPKGCLIEFHQRYHAILCLVLVQCSKCSDLKKTFDWDVNTITSTHMIMQKFSDMIYHAVSHEALEGFLGIQGYLPKT